MNTTKSKQQTTPKPYSAYTIYFRLERMRILHENGVPDNEIKASFDPNHFDPLEHPRPIKYRDVALPPYWYSSVHRKEVEKRRKHRKQEGMFSKAILTAMISRSWHEIDAEIRQYCNKLAIAEKQKYKGILKATSTCDDEKPEFESLPSSQSITPTTASTKEPSVEARDVLHDSRRTMESVLDKIYPELFDEGSFDDGFRFNFSQGVL